MADEKKRKDFLRVQARLKDDHHLLKSVVRVEQLEKIDQHTFFELSFDRMKEALSSVKCKPELRAYVPRQEPLPRNTLSLPAKPLPHV